MDYLSFEMPSSVDTSLYNAIDCRKEPELIDIRRMIQTYAWRRYCKSVGVLKRVTKRKRKHFFSINWDDLKFNHSTHMTKVEDEDLNPVNLPTSRLSLKQLNKTDDRHSYRSLDIRAPQVINSTRLENSDDKDAIHMFSTDKETKAKFTVEFNTCYSLGDKTNIELTVPAIYVSPTNHVDCRLLVRETSGERLKETVKWAVDAVIPVKSGHTVSAMLSAQEQQTHAEFDVLTNLSLQKQWLSVNIHKKSDRSVVYTCLITDLHEVFRRFQGPNLCLSSVSSSGHHHSHDVTLVSRGMCTIEGWSDVHVFVTTKNIQTTTGLLDIDAA